MEVIQTNKCTYRQACRSDSFKLNLEDWEILRSKQSRSTKRQKSSEVKKMKVLENKRPITEEKRNKFVKLIRSPEKKKQKKLVLFTETNSKTVRTTGSDSKFIHSRNFFRKAGGRFDSGNFDIPLLSEMIETTRRASKEIVTVEKLNL